jgi:quinol-cytochrome oxidoreductase complex cytochrome b subunit
MLKSIVRWVDNRVGTTKFTRKSLNKVFPDHWSFMLGEVALYCFIVLIATGTYLTFFFTPASNASSTTARMCRSTARMCPRHTGRCSTSASMSKTDC